MSNYRKSIDSSVVFKNQNNFAIDQHNKNDDDDNKNKNIDDDDDDNELTSCGIGSWRPKWLQIFSNPIFFLINLSLVGIIQSMNGPIFFSTMSTLEKRYAFDSRISGIILIADNISQFMLSPIVGYIAVRFNRARLIAFSEMFLAFSCFLTAMPYFIYGPAELFVHNGNNNNMTIAANNNWSLNISNTTTTTTTTSTIPILAGPSMFQNRKPFELCSDDNAEMNEMKCTNNRGHTKWLAVVILFFGSFFRGIGFTCFFVIGFPYLDDNVGKKNSPMYMSIIQAIRLIGPASGYLLSSFCLRFFENPFVDPGITRKDPRFVGAWWLAFCIVGVLLFIATLPLFLFPAQLKNASVKADKMKKKMKAAGGSIQALKRFLTNPVIMLYLAGSIFRYIGIGGYIMLKTKYIESQFRQSSSSASFITGTTSIMPMAIGILLGGAIISLFRPSTHFILIYVFIVEGLSIFTLGSGMFLGCDPLKIDGHYDSMGRFALNAPCNQHCSCTVSSFSPVCGADGRTTYFSPCYAGCRQMFDSNQTLTDCSCVNDVNSQATIGYCQSDVDNCTNLFTYLIVVLCGAIVSSTARTANALISFRSVEPMDKGFTMGAASSFMAILAFIPYPLIFGSIADAACLVWESSCGKTGNCWLYDQEKFRYYFHGACVFFMALGSIFDFIMIFFADRIKNFYDDDDDNDNDNGVNVKNNIDQERQPRPTTIINEKMGKQLSINFIHQTEMCDYNNHHHIEKK
nr:solute carrier organic anion transporter family member 74D-like [Dermatophagoides farinae]